MNKLLFVKAGLPTRFGDFIAIVWEGAKGNEPVALVTPNLSTEEKVLVRVHSECLTGDAFGSLKCDCGDQAQQALFDIAESGNGVFIYHRQEGRGVGLFEKMKAYALSEREGLDTYEAMLRLGHQADARDYEDPIRILNELGIKKLVLLTNNPAKIIELQESGFEVEQQKLIIDPNPHNETYLKTKKEKFGHTLS